MRSVSDVKPVASPSQKLMAPPASSGTKGVCGIWRYGTLLIIANYGLSEVPLSNFAYLRIHPFPLVRSHKAHPDLQTPGLRAYNSTSGCQYDAI